MCHNYKPIIFYSDIKWCICKFNKIAMKLLLHFFYSIPTFRLHHWIQPEILRAKLKIYVGYEGQRDSFCIANCGDAKIKLFGDLIFIVNQNSKISGNFYNCIIIIQIDAYRI